MLGMPETASLEGRVSVEEAFFCDMRSGFRALRDGIGVAYQTGR